jgi:hypothetical protein
MLPLHLPPLQVLVVQAQVEEVVVRAGARRRCLPPQVGEPRQRPPRPPAVEEPLLLQL